MIREKERLFRFRIENAVDHFHELLAFGDGRNLAVALRFVEFEAESPIRAHDASEGIRDFCLAGGVARKAAVLRGVDEAHDEGLALDAVRISAFQHLAGAAPPFG